MTKIPPLYRKLGPTQFEVALAVSGAWKGTNTEELQLSAREDYTKDFVSFILHSK